MAAVQKLAKCVPLLTWSQLLTFADAAPKSRDWADDEDFDDPTVLPPETRTKNKDGTETTITWKLNDIGQKVKTTRRIRMTVVRETVNPTVAARREWSKFGKEHGRATGPNSETTTVGENILFRPSVTWRSDAKDVSKQHEEETLKDKLRDKKVNCRICKGEHFTARCPYKDSMPAPPEPGADTADVGLEDSTDKEGGLTSNAKGGYIPPHLRKGGGASGGERMGGGKFGEKDDLATLRVTNVSEFAEEQDLRDIFTRYGHVTRVFLGKDRDTGRAKGFAFISYADRNDAAKACDKLDGYGYGHLILRVEFAKRAT